MLRRGFFGSLLGGLLSIPAFARFRKDDTPWIQAAIDECVRTGNNFTLQNGTYTLRSTLYPRGPVTVKANTFYCTGGAGIVMTGDCNSFSSFTGNTIKNARIAMTMERF
jgi:hypothetical protein